MSCVSCRIARAYGPLPAAFGPIASGRRQFCRTRQRLHLKGFIPPVLTRAASTAILCHRSGHEGIRRNELLRGDAPLGVTVVELDVEAPIIVRPADFAGVIALWYRLNVRVGCARSSLLTKRLMGPRNGKVAGAKQATTCFRVRLIFTHINANAAYTAHNTARFWSSQSSKKIQGVALASQKFDCRWKRYFAHKRKEFELLQVERA